MKIRLLIAILTRLALTIATIAITVSSSPSLASNQSVAYVTAISIDNNGGPYVFLASGTRTAKPACATDDFWAIADPTGDRAKALLANIMTAYSLGKRINVQGTGTCDSVHTSRETVSYIIF